MFCVVCQDDVRTEDAQDAMECLQCKQALHEACFNDYSEKLEEKQGDDGVAVVPCPTCRHTVTMQAVKHRQWAALLNVIQSIRQRSDAGLLADIPTVTAVLSGILTSAAPSAAVVVTYVCKCLYGISVGRDDFTLELSSAATRCIATCLYASPDDDELALWACAALYTLAKNTNNDVPSAFRAIVACMQTHKAVVIISYYAAMTFRVCLAVSATTAHEVVSTALAPCLEALEHHRSPLITRAVSWLILSLALLPDYKTALGAAGCIRTLSDIAVTHADKNDEGMLYTFSALSNLLVGSPENKKIACDVGLVRVVSDVLRLAVLPTVIVEACDILTCLVRYTSDAIDDIRACDGAVGIWKAWGHNENNAAVLKACMTALLAFYRNGVDAVPAFVTAFAFPAACRVLLRFTASEDTCVVKTAFKLIAVLPYAYGDDDGSEAETTTLPALSVLAAILQYVKRDDRDQKHACLALARLLQTKCLRLGVGNDMDASAGVDLAVNIFMNSFYGAPRHASVLVQTLIEVSGGCIRAAFSRPVNCTRLVAVKLVDAVSAKSVRTEHALRVLSLICEHANGDMETSSFFDQPCLTEVESMLLSHGILLPLVELLKAACDAAPSVPLGFGVVGDALRVLCSLCRDGRVRHDAAQCGVVPALVDVYFWTTDESVYLEIVSTILRLVGDQGSNALALLRHSDGIAALSVSATRNRHRAPFCVDGIDFWDHVDGLLRHGLGVSISVSELASLDRVSMSVSELALQRRVAEGVFGFCSHAQWCDMLQTDASGWCVLFSDLLSHRLDDSHICFSLCYVLDTVLLWHAAPLCSDAVVSSLLSTLTAVLQTHSADLFLACWVARCLIRLGDVHDTLFYQRGCATAILDAHDVHPHDDTLFQCMQHACTITAGCSFRGSVLRACRRVF